MVQTVAQTVSLFPEGKPQFPTDFLCSRENVHFCTKFAAGTCIGRIHRTQLICIESSKRATVTTNKIRNFIFKSFSNGLKTRFGTTAMFIILHWKGGRTTFFLHPLLTTKKKSNTNLLILFCHIFPNSTRRLMCFISHWLKPFFLCLDPGKRIVKISRQFPSSEHVDKFSSSSYPIFLSKNKVEGLLAVGLLSESKSLCNIGKLSVPRLQHKAKTKVPVE